MVATRPTIRIPGLPDGEAFTEKQLQERAYVALKKTLRDTLARQEPKLRVAADLVLELLQEDGTYKRYELIANGTQVRDPESRRVWSFAIGRKIVSDAAPRLFAAIAATKRTQELGQGP
jgi:hypothetical protein